MVDLEKIRYQVLKGKSLEEVLGKFDWKEFEESVAEILKAHEFSVKQNFRFKTKRRYEIDVIGVRGNFCLCIDCKNWSRGRNKIAALRKAIKQQETRVGEFKKFLKKNFVARGILKIQNSFLFLPLLITLADEELVKVSGTCVSGACVVPFEKLNSFLLEIEKYS